MKKHLFTHILLVISSLLIAQVETSSELYKTIKEKDSLLFNIGFNACDISQFENLVSDDFDFYHDQAGITSSKTDFIQSIENGLCKLSYKPKRVLAKNSLEVFPLMKKGILYGAIQTGIHNFYAIEKDQTEYLTSTAKFTHLWILENSHWKLKNSLSYDHKDYEKPIDKEKLFIDKAETERWLTQNNIPTLGIGYINNGSLEDISVYGNLEENKPAPKNTIWNVASLTKPITALVALKLVNNGDWNLDEPVYKYWIDPDVKNDPNSKILTTRHILSHQTGFKNWRWNDEKLPTLKFQFTPGTKYQYSGEGYEYLRKALENKFGTTLDKLADSLIFKPLKMKDTQFLWNKKTDESRFAKWFDNKGNQYEFYKTLHTNAADDLLTTVEDYTKFMIHILNGADLSKELYQEMISDQVRVNNYKHFGLGWWVDENINTNNDFALVHGGDDIGFHTIAFLIPNTKQGLLIFTNCDNGTEIFTDVLLKYLGKNGQGILDVEMK